jgi:hypothetical protein
MVKVLSSRILWGIILIIGGILLLLDTFGYIHGGSLFWTIVLALAGLLFVALYVTQHEHWWALIPGIIFLAIATTVGLNAFLPGFGDSSIQGTMILGGIGLSFLCVYLADRGNWWAIIPAGVMATLAIVAIPVVSDTALTSGGIFFLGLGITFALVALLPNSVGPMRWAWIPAGILGVFGILLVISAENLINYIWPALLIIGGGALLVRAFRK